MKRLWRILIGIVKWTAIVVVALLILGFGLSYVVPKPHVPPLPPGRRTVAAADNGWPLLKAAALRLKASADCEQLYPFLTSPGAPSAEVVHLVADNGSALRLLDESLARPDLLLPPPESPGLNSLWPYEFKIPDLARLKSARGLLRLRGGDTAAGLDDLLGVTRLGRRVENGGGSLIDYLTGTEVEAIGLRAVLTALGPAPAVVLKDHDPVKAWPRSGWTAQQMALWRQACREIAGTANWVRPFQQTMVEEIDHFALSFRHPEKFIISMDKGAKKTLPRIRSTAILDINLTIAQGKMITAILTREAAKSRPQRHYDEIRRVLNPRGPAWLYNPAGRILLAMMAPVWQHSAVSMDRRSAWVTATAASIALKLYLEQHGHLPANWTPLVQTGLLQSVPIDPFDGKPLRYRPRRGLIYSVGENGRDDGGRREHYGSKAGTDDLVFPLYFVTNEDQH